MSDNRRKISIRGSVGSRALLFLMRMICCKCWKTCFGPMLCTAFFLLLFVQAEFSFAFSDSPTCKDPMRTEIYSSKITCGTVEVIATTIRDSETPYMAPDRYQSSSFGHTVAQKLTFYDLKKKKTRGVAIWVNPLSGDGISWTLIQLKCVHGAKGDYLLASAVGWERYEWEEVYDLDGRHLSEVTGKFDENHIERIVGKCSAVKKKLGITDAIDSSTPHDDDKTILLGRDTEIVNKCLD